MRVQRETLDRRKEQIDSGCGIRQSVNDRIQRRVCLLFGLYRFVEIDVAANCGDNKQMAKVHHKGLIVKHNSGPCDYQKK